MSVLTSRIYSGVLHLSIIVFTSALVWFAFVYYPKVVSQYKTGNFPKKMVVQPVAARSNKFPIETVAYRLVWDQNSDAYYAFIEGKNLDEYVVNRNNAQLALKTALSKETLCQVNIVYVSTGRLKVPPSLQDNSNCK